MLQAVFAPVLVLGQVSQPPILPPASPPPTTPPAPVLVFCSDQAYWPDAQKDCGTCKVLVDDFRKTYETCNGYCETIGHNCSAAWDDENTPSCQVKSEMACSRAKKTSRAICECTLGPTPPAPPESPPPPAITLGEPSAVGVAATVLLALVVLGLLAGCLCLPGTAPKALMDRGEAEAQTTRIAGLMPKDWQRDDLKADELDLQTNQGRDTRADCQPLLKDITRAVPLKLLLEHGVGSLHRAKQKEDLTTSHFFLSSPVSKLKAFVSHRWDTDPRETADALTIQAKLPLFISLNVIIFVIMAVLGLMFPPMWFLLFPFLGALPVAVFTAKSDLLLWLAGATKPLYWFDKATVHQTRKCVTAAGLHLFAYFLQRSDRLMILFKPVYLTRVWCVYELAWWLKHKGNRGITFVPLTGSANMYRLLLRVWPMYWALGVFFGGCGFCSGFLTFGRLNEKGSEDFRDFFMYILMAMGIFWSLFVFCVTAAIGQIVVSPAEEERELVANKLRSFDVRETVAWSQDDKAFVLGEISKWWSTEAQGDAALDAFNQFVRTQVATRLDEFQRRRKWQVMALVLFLAVQATAYAYLGLLSVMQYIETLAWPDFWLASARFVSPDDCYGDDPASTCFGPWDTGPLALFLFLALVTLCCAIGCCQYSLRRAKRATQAPVYRICCLRLEGDELASQSGPGAGSARVTPAPPH